MLIKNQKTILIVDDQLTIAMLWAKNLRILGYEVITVNSGKKAYELIINEQVIDLILMDIDLGKGIDGIETAKLILNYRDVPIIYLSNHDDPEILQRTEQTATYGYVLKSSSLSVLKASINMALNLYEDKMKAQTEKEEIEIKFESLPDLLFEVGLNGFIHYCQTSHPEQLYRPPAEILGKLISEILPENAAKIGMEAIKEAHSKGFSLGKQYCLTMPDGIHWYELSISRMIHYTENIRFIALSRDITLRKKMENNDIKTLTSINTRFLKNKSQRILFSNCQNLDNVALSKSEKGFRKLFQLPSIGVAIVSVEGKWLEVNDYLCMLLGYTREELLNLSWMDLTPVELVVTEVAGYKEALINNQIDNFSLEKSYIRKNGISINVIISIMAEKRLDGSIDHFFVLVQNIPDKKHKTDKTTTGRRYLGEMISSCSQVHKIFDSLPVIAAYPSTILIFGETGTGKEVHARAIHQLSHYRKGPFIAVNCGSLPDTLIESELFGYKTGAFTGANRDKPGKFHLAKGGTLFLDEIGELSLAMQTRLLRVLQEKTFEPLGASYTETTDARIIVATNRDLYDLMKQGKFRQDLYYRINVISLKLPPLRERKPDIPDLINIFIEKKNKLLNKNIRKIKSDALSVLLSHDWPGNIRELENVIERSMIMCDNFEIGMDNLPDEILACKYPQNESNLIQQARKQTEASILLEILEHNQYNYQATAKELGINRSTVFRKVKQLKIKLPPKKVN